MVMDAEPAHVAENSLRAVVIATTRADPVLRILARSWKGSLPHNTRAHTHPNPHPSDTPKDSHPNHSLAVNLSPQPKPQSTSSHPANHRLEGVWKVRGQIK